MVENILVAVDASVNSRKAARFALGLAEQTKARVTLLTVLEPPEVVPVGPLSGYVMTSPPTSEADAKAALGVLEEVAAEHPRVQCTRRVELGRVTDTILEYADKQGVDLIVLGARGLSPAGRWLLGSVSDRVVHHAHCPVVVWR